VQLPQHKLLPCHAALLCLPLDTADAATAAIANSGDTSGSCGSKQGSKQQQRQRKPKTDSAERSSSNNRSRSSIDFKNSRMQANTLYVQNLAWSIETEHLQDAFRNSPGYEDAFIKINKDGRPAGYGFVRFGSEETAAAAEAVSGGMVVLHLLVCC
jgi:hypothetical protein